MAKKKKTKKNKNKEQSKDRFLVIAYDTLISEHPVVLREAIDHYIRDCEDYNERLTITGMALSIGLTRKSLVNFNKTDDEEVVAVINYAKQRVEEHLEQRLGGASPAGAVFNLKANFGWQDVQKVSLGSGPNGDDPIATSTTIDASKLSTKALKELMALRGADNAGG